MTLRKWLYTDILAVSEIENRIFPRPWTYNMLAETFLAGSFTGYIAEENGELCGFGGYVNSAGSADITRIAVVEKHRKKGVGGALLQMIIDSCRARHAYEIILEVRVSNTAATALYSGAGFAVIAVRKNYYGDEDAYVMRLEL